MTSPYGNSFNSVDLQISFCVLQAIFDPITKTSGRAELDEDNWLSRMRAASSEIKHRVHSTEAPSRS